MRSNTKHIETVSDFVDEFKLDYSLAFSIHVNIVSGHTDKKQKESREKNFSGFYHLVEFVNDRPVYKVSISYLQEKLATKDLVPLNFSGTKRLNMVMKYISGTVKP